MATGRPIPEKLVRPDMLRGAELYWQAFVRLSSERLMELGPIPYSKILWYADYHGFDERQSEWCMKLVSKMDETLLKKTREKMDRERESSRTGKGHKSSRPKV